MLAFDRAGQGLPLVFVHAFPLSRKMWEGITRRLPNNINAIAVDLPGFGESSLSSDTSSMESMANQIVSTLDHVGLQEPVVAVGISMGGYVLFQLAKLFPNRFRGLVLISTRSAADSLEIRQRRFKTIEIVRKQDGINALAEKMIPQLFGQTTLSTQPELVSQVRRWITQASPVGVCAALRGMAERIDSTPNLNSISVPTLVLSGQEDVFVKTDEMELMAKAIPDSVFHVVEKAGHLLPLEQPDIFLSILDQFLYRKVGGN